MLSWAFTQQLLAQTRTNPTPPLQPSTAISDTAAQTELQQMITASGGLQVWSAMGNALLRYRNTDTTGAQQPDRLMLDDWASDKTRYRRGAVGMTRKPVDHDGRSSLQVVEAKGSATTQTAKKPVTIPEFDQARVLASHIPAAAAIVVLRNPAYIAKTVSECAVGKTCLNIYRQSAPQAPFRLEQKWVLDASTHLPSEIKLLLADLIPRGDGTWKSSFFSDYRPEQAVQLPHRIAFGMQGAAGSPMELVSAKFGMGFDAAAFDREAGK